MTDTVLISIKQFIVYYRPNILKDDSLFRAATREDIESLNISIFRNYRSLKDYNIIAAYVEKIKEDLDYSCYVTTLLCDTGKVIYITEYCYGANETYNGYVAIKYLTERNPDRVVITKPNDHTIFSYLSYNFFNKIELVKQSQYIKDENRIYVNGNGTNKITITIDLPENFDIYFKQHFKNNINKETLEYIKLSDNFKDLR